MTTKTDVGRFKTNDVIDLAVRCHSDGYFVRDPSPSVFNRKPRGKLAVAEEDLEKRSHVEVPARSLCQLWSLMHGRSDRLKFEAGRAYLRRRSMEADLEEALRLHTENQLERCFHTNRDFQVIQVGDLVWNVRRQFVQDAMLPVLHDPDRFLEPGDKQLKDARTTTLAVTPGDTVLKRFNLKKYRNLVKYHFIASRARRAFQNAFHLESIGIKTSRVVAFAERRMLGSVVRSYVLMEYLTDTMECDKAFRHWRENDSTVIDKALGNVGRLIGRLHGAGFANRDLKARNILMTKDGEAGLIDLDGLTHSDRVNLETRIKNLRRIARDMPAFGELSVRERMAFLRAYARASRGGRAAEFFRRLSEEPWE